MIAHFVRIASLAFAVFSVLYWTAVWVFVELVELLNERLTQASFWDRIGQALPALFYGVIVVLFCQWFAKGIVRRMQSGGDS